MTASQIIAMCQMICLLMLLWGLWQDGRVMRRQSLLMKDYQKTIKALQEQIDWQNGDLSRISHKLVQANNKIAMLTMQNENLRSTVAVLTDAAEED